MNKFEEIIKIADIHASRIDLALSRLHHLFPINTAALSNLSDELLPWIELLVSRFAKLQDIIGAKIIDLFLETQLEDTSNFSLLDKLHKLE